MQEIYSPIESYKSLYKQLHNDNTTSLFDELVKKSEIDIEANRVTSKKIAENNALNSSNQKSLRKYKTGKIISIALIIISAIVIIYTIVKGALIPSISFPFNIDQRIAVTATLFIPILISVLLINKASKKLKELYNIERVLQEKGEELRAVAEQQMQPLNALLQKNYNNELFSKTIPLIQLDSSFDNKRLDYMIGKFGFNASDQEQDIEQSTLFIQSGEIKGNPFFIRNYLQHTMGIKAYKGTRTITWTTRTQGADGKTQTRHHSQTLVATVKKPCPYYKTASYLIYANESGGDLSFSRKPSQVHKLDEKKIDSFIDKRSKKLQQLAEKATKKGETFTALGNNEFDALFYATNRDHESQFRLLFTPLAQQEMIKVMKDNSVGFGDDFAFDKHKMINYIYPKHLQDTVLNVESDYFTGINYEEVRSHFLGYHNSYFKHLFFTFAPIFAIPLYTQQQTQEYIYKDLYDSCMNFYQHEVAANGMNTAQIMPPESVTTNIVKTSLVRSKDNVDTVSVNSWGYRTTERTEYVRVRGNDNKVHDVPVRWTEYNKVTKKSEIEIQAPVQGA